MGAAARAAARGRARDGQPGTRAFSPGDHRALFEVVDPRSTRRASSCPNSATPEHLPHATALGKEPERPPVSRFRFPWSDGRTVQ